jgi:hypothetical protein
MSARPSSGFATVTMNSINIALVAGQALVSFIPNSTTNNPVAFNISTLKNNTRFLVKISGATIYICPLPHFQDRRDMDISAGRCWIMAQASRAHV